MTDHPASPDPGPDPWADWITIWQSELAALAGDREMHEAVQRAVDFWAAQASLAARLLGPPADVRARDARPVAPPRPAPAADAPDPRDAAIQQLLARVAELERRLAELGPA